MRTVDSKEEELFLQAIDLSRTARIEFLEHHCQSDATLLGRLEKLLRLHEEDDFILDQTLSLVAHKQETVSDRDLGTSLGNYRLVHRIGTGGMGVVYLAEQLRPVQRRVALKIIKLGMDTSNVIARFEAERQTLALMEHPSITKVFDAGATPTGRPYFVMELVNGSSITEYCDQKRLRIDQRLELFMQVCNAVQHAHQKGVIHRDIKPSNILVTDRDGQPIPKIIDFGIAKATTFQKLEDTRITDQAGMVGTPEYMSPEQADFEAWDLDTRTDIYSLGAVLYELCTGQSPLKNDLHKKGLPHVREIIQTRQPKIPSLTIALNEDKIADVCGQRSENPRTLERILKGDIDSIVLKCLSKDRSERYETAADLTREIERYLKGDPVDAVAPSFAYRWLKYTQKHRFLLSAAVAIFAVLSISLFISIRSALSAYHLAHRALAAESLAQQRLRDANRAGQSAELERRKSLMAKKNLKVIQRNQENQLAIMRAIAKFHASAWDVVSPNAPVVKSNPPTVSTWLTQELGINREQVGIPESTKLRNIESGTSGSGDVQLLELVLQEQRDSFGSVDLFVAKTLDLLGEKLLNLDSPDEATVFLRESFSIRTQNGPNDLDRVNSMYLLARSLRLSGKRLEAQSYLEAARKRLNGIPSGSHLWTVIEREIEKL